MIDKELIEQLRKTVNMLAIDTQGTPYESSTEELARQVHDDLDTLEKRLEGDKPT